SQVEEDRSRASKRTRCFFPPAATPSSNSLKARAVSSGWSWIQADRCSHEVRLAIACDALAHVAQEMTARQIWTGSLPSRSNLSFVYFSGYSSGRRVSPNPALTPEISPRAELGNAAWTTLRCSSD